MKKNIVFLLCATFLFTSSCKKDKSSDAAPSSAAYYIVGTFDGNALKIEQQKATDHTGYLSGMEGGAISASNIANCLHSQGSAFLDALTAGTSKYHIGIFKVFPPDGNGDCTLTQAQAESMLYVGTFSFASTTAEEGAYVQIDDGSGNTWSTEDGSQAGSTFKITSYENDELGIAPKIVTYEFTCKLYNSAGSVKDFSATWKGRALVY